jgi:hypothetical protein
MLLGEQASAESEQLGVTLHGAASSLALILPFFPYFCLWQKDNSFEIRRI